MVAGTRGSSSLNCVSAFWIALEVEPLGDADVNVFGIPHCGRIVVAVDQRHRPSEIAIVRISAKFNAALGRSKSKGIVRRPQAPSKARLIVNIIIGGINGSGLREGQVKL